MILKQVTDLRATDVRISRGAESGSDRFLVKAEIYVKYKNEEKITRVEKDEPECIEEKQYNLDLLTDDSVKFLYKIRVANKPDSIQEKNVENMYERSKTVLHEAAFESLGERHGKHEKKRLLVE